MIKLIYDFDMYEFKVSFIWLSERGITETLGSYCLDYPEANIYGPSTTSLGLALAADLEAFMVDKYLRKIGITEDGEQDRKAFFHLRRSQRAVREELRTSPVAHIMYKNWYLEITDEYPIERFEKVCEPVLNRNDRFIVESSLKAGIDLNEVAEIELAGSECEYEFVRRHVQEMFGIECTYVK